MEDYIKVLIIEDKAEDAGIIRDVLEKSTMRMKVHRVENLNEALSEISHIDPDILISEYELADCNASQALNILRENRIHLPLIVVSDKLDPITATDVMKAGAADYVIKDKLLRLPNAVQKVIVNSRKDKESRSSYSNTIKELESRVAIRTAELENCTRRLNGERDKRLDAERYIGIMDRFLPDPVFRYNQQKGVSWSNRAAGSFFQQAGIASGGSQSLDRLFSGEPSWRQMIADVINRRKEHTVEKEIEVGGKAYSFRIVPDEQGGEKEVWVIAREITQLHHIKEKLAEKQIQLQRVQSQRSEFMSIVSHDLRAPLTSIVGFAETMITPDIVLSDEEKRRFLEIIKDEGKRLGEFIGSFLEVSRIESGEMSLQLDQVPLFGLLHEVISSQADFNGVDVIIPDDYKQEIMLQVDEKRMKKIFSSIMSNLIDGLPSGGVVSFFVEETESDIEIAVTAGVNRPDSSERARIFDRLFRGEAREWNQSQRGAELKLMIAKGLIKAHGGQIFFDSYNENGKTFYVQLPVKMHQAV